MKVSLTAIKLSLHGLTNVKKEKVLGITGRYQCFILSQMKFHPLLQVSSEVYHKYSRRLLVFHPVEFTGKIGHRE